MKKKQPSPALSKAENIAITNQSARVVLATPLGDVVYASLQCLGQHPFNHWQLKPEAIERPIHGLFINPIPDTKYSIRIWPGPIFNSIYNMDFVLSQPVNSPFEFLLWAIASIDNSWATTGMFPRQIHSLERTIKPEKGISQGEGKFILEDGEAYAIRRPGKCDTLFVIPKRSIMNPPCSIPPNGDVLNFPSSI